MFYQSFDYLLGDAIETGGLELAESAIVAEIRVDGEGPVSAVRHLERLAGSERTVPARRAVVAGSTGGSTRLLLDSESCQFSKGIGSSVTGRY